jgi:hypothetical protein
MGYFKELDLMIQERCNYNPDTRENENTYLQFKDEIEMHISGQLQFDQLSPIAQDLIRDWESVCESMSARDYAEMPEDFSIGPNDV